MLFLSYAFWPLKCYFIALLIDVLCNNHSNEDNPSIMSIMYRTADNFEIMKIWNHGWMCYFFGLFTPLFTTVQAQNFHVYFRHKGNAYTVNKKHAHGKNRTCSWDSCIIWLRFLDSNIYGTRVTPWIWRILKLLQVNGKPWAIIYVMTAAVLSYFHDAFHNYLFKQKEKCFINFCFLLLTTCLMRLLAVPIDVLVCCW